MTKSAWRGLAGSGITPRRITSYRGDPRAAAISMAQHARPHWYTQREYFRAVLNSEPRGLGMRPFSTSPTIGPSRSLRSQQHLEVVPQASQPLEDALSPCIDEPEGEDDDEDDHLHEAEDVVGLEAQGPR